MKLFKAKLNWVLFTSPEAIKKSTKQKKYVYDEREMKSYTA